MCYIIHSLYYITIIILHYYITLLLNYITLLYYIILLLYYITSIVVFAAPLSTACAGSMIMTLINIHKNMIMTLMTNL